MTSALSAQPTWNCRGQVVVVTGAARGIGRATAELFAASGAQIVAVDVSDAVLSAGSVTDAAWHPVVGDIAETTTVEHTVQTCREAPGRPAVLVSCAFAEQRAPLLSGTTDGWLSTYHVSTLAAVEVSRAFVTAFATDQPAALSVVNVASVHAYAAAPDFGAYAAAKAALLAFTRAAAVEWAHLGVRVNAVAPGFIAVERNESVWNRAGGVQQLAPLGRAGTPQEVAGAIAFLASSAASFITGVSLPIDGGLLAQLPKERQA